MGITQGPWRVAPASEIYIVDGRVNDLLILAPALIPVACCHELAGSYRDPIDMKANAALIAAAPEMLSLLLKLHHQQLAGPGGGDEEKADWEAFMIEARYVIAKAMGIFDSEMTSSIMETDNCIWASKVTVDCRVGNSRE